MILVLLNSKSYSTFLWNLFQNLWKNKIFPQNSFTGVTYDTCLSHTILVTWSYFYPFFWVLTAYLEYTILLEDRHIVCLYEGLPEDLITSLSNCPLPASPSRAWETVHSIILQPAIYSWSCHAVKLRPSLEYRKILMEMAGPFLLYNPLL